jgi:hypothetical protein
MQALSQLSYGPTRRGGTVPDSAYFVKEMDRRGYRPPSRATSSRRGGDDDHQQGEYRQTAPIFQCKDDRIVMHMATGGE